MSEELFPIPTDLIATFFEEAEAVFALRMTKEFRILSATAAFSRIVEDSNTPVGQNLSEYLVVAPGTDVGALIGKGEPHSTRLPLRLAGGGACVVVAHVRSVGEELVFLAEPFQMTGTEALDEVSRLNNELAGVARELRDKKRALEEALQNVKTLKSLLPMCAWCRKVRDDDGYWDQLERYVLEHSGTKFTHGICPECTKKLGV